MAGRTKTLKLLTAAEILAAVDTQEKIVEVPEWGGSVRIVGLTGLERDRYEAWIIQGKGKNRDVNLAQSRAKLVMMCARDADGNRLFDESQVIALGKKNAKALQRVFDVAGDLSGLDEDTLEKIQDDLGNAPSDDSGSA
jgi:hypothetical protein